MTRFNQASEEHPFFGKHIPRNREQAYIKNLLKKYQGEQVSDELKHKIWEELQLEKFKGNITIPFKITMRRDNQKKFPDFIEVILDTKV